MSSILRRTLMSVSATVVAVTLALVPSGASAADEIGLGRDGLTFAPTLTAPLFASAVRWVPGDVRTERFWVRNNTSAPATLEIDLRSDPIGSLLASGDLLITAVAPGGGAVTVTGNGQVLTNAPVAAGASVPVDVTVTFSASSTSRTENLSSNLIFGIRLTDASGAGSGPVAQTSLPSTGADVPLWLILAAAASVAIGTILIRRPRPSGVTHV